MTLYYFYTMRSVTYRRYTDYLGTFRSFEASRKRQSSRLNLLQCTRAAFLRFPHPYLKLIVPANQEVFFRGNLGSVIANITGGGAYVVLCNCQAIRINGDGKARQQWANEGEDTYLFSLTHCLNSLGLLAMTSTSKSCRFSPISSAFFFATQGQNVLFSLTVINFLAEEGADSPIWKYGQEEYPMMVNLRCASILPVSSPIERNAN